MGTCGQNLDLRECHGTPRYLTTVYSLTLLKLLDTSKRRLQTPKHQKLAEIVTTIFKRSLDVSHGRQGEIVRHRGVSRLAAADARCQCARVAASSHVRLLASCAQQIPMLCTG